MAAIPVPAGQHRQQTSTLSDADLVPLAKMGDESAIRTIVQRHNQRLFRTARAVIRNDWEAEDVVQAAYTKAFTNLAAFRGEAQLSTWLTRITLNEALGRVRARKNTTGIEEIDMQTAAPGGEVLQFPSSLSATDPETELSRSEARHLLENAVDELPDDFRAVFVLRDVEGMSTEEAASYLGIRPETAKTRLHRARKMMRQSIQKKLSGAFSALFPFDGARCACMVDRVIAALHDDTR
ncbi:RNA polymerase sigma factor [Rhizobium leguminosarum]|uniref:RNA polymerase sigma factor n=1 Tax=Rhizobium leguminosarum TaxID=384 RepID=A0A6P0BFN0_RHILE|nr:RNA polymerase sigma factor [Rhizobium leguminosarum]MBY5438825.1 RNA polymerase sigma factor [Rhizobium leguminosarum]NEI37601.1 RNA polymerase sigma factor [Rhizobium leguminosarum]NEI44242.1 RNA polymerase sigma factor [Rhizobium leguminosarum]